MAREVVIVSAARTPIGAFQGGLAGLTAPQLGSVAITAAHTREDLDLALQILEDTVVRTSKQAKPA